MHKYELTTKRTHINNGKQYVDIVSSTHYSQLRNMNYSLKRHFCVVENYSRFIKVLLEQNLAFDYLCS